MKRFLIANQVIRWLHCALKLIQKHASGTLSDHTQLWKWHIVWPHSAVEVVHCLTTLSYGSGTLSDHTQLWKWHIVWPHSALEVAHCLTTLSCGSGTLSDHTQLWKWHIVWPHSALEVTHCLTTLSSGSDTLSDYTQLPSIRENSPSLINRQSHRQIFTVHTQSEAAGINLQGTGSVWDNRNKPA